MGLFSKIGDAFSKVGDAVGDFFKGAIGALDDLTGGTVSKILGNKWVKGAMLAVSIVTGGVAIANGVMAAGKAGVGAALKNFATNMSMETGKSLVSSVINGAKQFIGGVAEGLLNPMQSDAGRSLRGFLDTATENITGRATSAKGLTAEAGKATQAVQDAKVAGITDAGDVASVGGSNVGQPMGADFAGPDGNMLAPKADEGLSLAKLRNSDPALGTDFGGVDGSMFTDDAMGFQDYFAAHQKTPFGADFAGSDGNMLPVPPAGGEPGTLAKLAQQGMDYVTSPVGMRTIAGIAQGAANRKAWEKMMQRREKERRRIGDSWRSQSGGGAVRFGPA